MLAKTGSGHLKPREERRRVMLPARMRSDSGWSDACILNLSSRGLLVYALGSAEPGSTVEIRRGSHLVVARVVWRQNHRVGLASARPLAIGEIISSETAAAASIPIAAPAKVERRRIARDSEQSRWRGRAIEFAALVALAAALGASVAAYVAATLARPLASLSAALGAQ